MKSNEKLNFDFLQPVDFLDKLTDNISKAFNDYVNWDVVKQQTPSVNVSQSENSVFLEIAIPGTNKEDVEISLEKNLLTVSCKKEKSKKRFTIEEFSYHSFSRSFNLSDSLDKDNIKSSMTNGVLTIEIGKLSPEVVNTQKKKIPVN